MVTVNRLTGHSPGFLSVYTLPPNQAVSVVSQRKINADREQTPPRRDLRAAGGAQDASLLADVDEPHARAPWPRRSAPARFQVGSCAEAVWEPETVQLVVTSPPFLDVVDYATDNWLRCWFCGIDAAEVPIEIASRSRRVGRVHRARLPRVPPPAAPGRISSPSRSARCDEAPSGWRKPCCRAAWPPA